MRDRNDKDIEVYLMKDGSGYGVKVRKVGGIPYSKEDFKTKAEARAWAKWH
jgi:hypothetical protein